MKKLLCLLLLGHKFSEWEVFTWCDELRAGGEIRTCGICGETEKQPIHLRSPNGKTRGFVELRPFAQVGTTNHNNKES